MVVVEIPPNPNCEPVEMRIFHPVDVPRSVRALHVAPDGGRAEWHEVTGWTADGAPCPALAQRVDDSGEGLAILIYGGSAGLRCRPLDSRQPWGLTDPRQWGLPFLLTADTGDIQFDEVADG